MGCTIGWTGGLHNKVAHWVAKKVGPTLTPWHLGGFGNFCKKKTAVFGCLTNALAPPPIALESSSTAQTDQPV